MPPFKKYDLNSYILSIVFDVEGKYSGCWEYLICITVPEPSHPPSTLSVLFYRTQE